MSNYYPPVGFHFKVEVAGLSNDLDARFTEVAGLSVEMGTEEVAEGGENRFIQRYPTRSKYPELVLKRGLVLPESGIWTWVRECIEDYNIRPRSIFIKLLGDAHEPLMTWRVVGAYPTGWTVSDLNASSNAVVIESLRFAYQYFTVEKGS